MLKPTEDPDGITNPYISSRLLTNAVAFTTHRKKERERVSDQDRGLLCVCVCSRRSRLKVASLEWKRDKLRVNSSLDCERRNARGDSSPFIKRDAT